MAIDLTPDKKTLVRPARHYWTLPVSREEAKLLTDTLGDSWLPAWPPDGNQVAFHSYRDGTYHTKAG